MKILTDTEQAKLSNQSRLKDLMTNDYLNDTYNSNFRTISNMFFDWNIEKTKEFNVWTNLFATVSDTIANFVWNPIMDISLNLTKYTKDLVSVWKAVFWIKRLDDGNLDVYYIPAENHLISDWINKVFTMYKNIEDNKTIYYILKQEFDVWVIRNYLFKLDKILNTWWDLVPLDTIPQTSYLKEEMQTWLEVPAIFYTDLNELDWIQSELDKIKNLVYSLDRKAVMFETQFLWQIDQYKIFENIDIPESAITEKWTVDITKLWKVVATTTWMNGDIKYISNRNELIGDAIKYENTQLQKVSSATSIPVDFLWIPTTSAVSWVSRQIMISAFTKKIQSYRDLLQDVLQDILIIFEWQRKEDWSEIETYILWDDILSKDTKELAEELKIAREVWIISQYSSIQQYQKLRNPEDIEKEIELIKNENLITNNTNNGESEI